MNFDFDQFLDELSRLGCRRLLVKRLACNDNSKNQIYLGNDFTAINLIPFSNVVVDNSGQGGAKKDRIKAEVKFAWMNENHRFVPVNLIMYPKYPEVRLSGLLKHQTANKDVAALVRGRAEGRILFLGITEEGRVIGHVSDQNDRLSHDFDKLSSNCKLSEIGVFYSLSIAQSSKTSLDILVDAMSPIVGSGWLDSVRLDKNGNIQECLSPNCGGYTLEAQLGIIPNGISAPDYCGWEVKQYGVTNFSSKASKAITLMTPEPDGGIYKDSGLEEFMIAYGYSDRKVDSRVNFGGVHKYGVKHSRTGLTMELDGYSPQDPKKWDASGAIQLVDDLGNCAASWSFSGLLKHWQRKHAQAVYARSMCRKSPNRQYLYSNELSLGVGTSFSLFLEALAQGIVYYDPGIKIENFRTQKQRSKRRSQMRVGSRYLAALYTDFSALEL